MLQTILLVLPVIIKLWPIAKEIYQMVADPDRPEQPEDALDLIVDRAKEEGLHIGHTEAELVRSAVHFVTAKKERHAAFLERD